LRLLSSRLGVGESFLYFGAGLGAGGCHCRSIAHTKPASSRTTAMIAVGVSIPRRHRNAPTAERYTQDRSAGC
ncbi:MAG TPA: hypothetical protein VLI39_10885, partial [Sedimentisphaerales bacterium]|nr:hypothetical protein [Sedimentisphaerales bacterium]